MVVNMKKLNQLFIFTFIFIFSLSIINTQANETTQCKIAPQLFDKNNKEVDEDYVYPYEIGEVLPDFTTYFKVVSHCGAENIKVNADLIKFDPETEGEYRLVLNFTDPFYYPSITIDAKIKVSYDHTPPVIHHAEDLTVEVFEEVDYIS